MCFLGLMHVDATVGALVDIIHAFTSCDLDNIHLAAKLYTRLLLHPVRILSLDIPHFMQ